MKAEYDPESDILYIRIKDERIEETIDLDDDVFADLNEKEEVVGIETLTYCTLSLGFGRVRAKYPSWLS